MSGNLTITEIEEYETKFIEDPRLLAPYESHAPVVERPRFLQGASPQVVRALGTKIPKEMTQKRPGPGGIALTYLTGHKAIEQANTILGHDGWCSEILKVETTTRMDGKQYVYETSAQMRVYALGVFHDDIGHGEGKNDNKLKARESAEKEAITDAEKRALRHFGEALGNSLYDKKHLQSFNTITNK